MKEKDILPRTLLSRVLRFLRPPTSTLATGGGASGGGAASDITGGGANSGGAASSGGGAAGATTGAGGGVKRGAGWSANVPTRPVPEPPNPTDGPRTRVRPPVATMPL